jgi:hypothetical protein
VPEPLLRDRVDARGIRRTLGPFREVLSVPADEPGSLEGTRDALATLVLLDDRRLSGGARGRMFRVGHENPLAVMAKGPAADGSGHPADHATEKRSLGSPLPCAPPAALSSPRAARATPSGRPQTGRRLCATSGTSVPLEEERRAPAPPWNLEPLALGSTNTPLDPLAAQTCGSSHSNGVPLMA